MGSTAFVASGGITLLVVVATFVLVTIAYGLLLRDEPDKIPPSTHDPLFIKLAQEFPEKEEILQEALRRLMVRSAKHDQ